MSIEDEVTKESSASTISNLSSQKVKNLRIPYISNCLEKQKAIGDFLNNKCSSIDKMIENEKSLLADLKNYLYSTISEHVLGKKDKSLKVTNVPWMKKIPSNWNIGKINSLCYLKGRIGWQGLTADEYQSEGPYLITGTDFVEGSINWNTCEHITEKRYEEASHIKVKENDLLITKDGTVGKVAIVSSLPNKASLNSGVMMIRNLSDKYETKYLYYVLKSSIFWDWFQEKQKGNSTIIHLYQEQFGKFLFPLPSIDEQKQICKLLDEKCSKINELISIKEEKIETLKKYKKSLIYECVTGKKEIQYA